MVIIPHFFYFTNGFHYCKKWLSTVIFISQSKYESVEIFVFVIHLKSNVGFYPFVLNSYVDILTGLRCHLNKHEIVFVIIFNIVKLWPEYVVFCTINLHSPSIRNNFAKLGINVKGSLWRMQITFIWG